MAIPKPPGFRPNSLGEKIERLLQRAISNVYEVLIEPVGDRLKAGVDNYLERMEQRLLVYARPMIDRLLEIPNLPSEVRIPLEHARDPGAQVEIAAIIGVVAGILVGVIQGAMQPFARLVSYFVERIVQTGRPDPVTLFQMERRGALDASQRDSYLDDLGVSDKLKNGFSVASSVRPGISELLTLWLRGYLNDAGLEQRLGQEGVPSEFVGDIKELARQIPGPGDLVRFALREAWRDDVAAKYGYDEDYVAEFGQWMEKIGYSADWARKFWRSHWELPSISLAMEMVHRGIISESEFKDLLRVQDIPAGWRDRVSKAIYSPYTRVDARRMHQLGVLKDDQLVNVYKSQGYDQEHAENMAEFTILFNQESDRDLTKSDILGGYRDGILDYGEAKSFLTGLRYDATEAEFYLSREDQKRDNKLAKLEIAVIEDLYLNGEIDLTEARTRLTALNTHARQMDLLLEEWRIGREKKVKRPSRATLERLFKSGAITLDDFTSTLSAIGYQPKYVDWYLRNIALERQTEVEKEEKRAREEKERIEKDRRRTDYQTAKAAIDVTVAETQAAIASAEVALVEAQNEKNERLRALLSASERAEIERDYMTAIHEADAAMARARVTVANLRGEQKTHRARQAQIRESLTTNVDVARQVELKTEDASIRVEIARIKVVIAEYQTAIRKIKEVILTLDDDDEIKEAKADILSLETDMAEENEKVKEAEVTLAEIAEQLDAVLMPRKRRELETELSNVEVEIRNLETRIAELQGEMAETAQVKILAKAEMERQLTALPDEGQVAEVRLKYDSLIEQIRAQVKVLRERLAGLRVQKAQITFEHREVAG
jgi:hypothetical protein